MAEHHPVVVLEPLCKPSGFRENPLYNRQWAPHTPRLPRLPCAAQVIIASERSTVI